MVRSYRQNWWFHFSDAVDGFSINFTQSLGGFPRFDVTVSDCRYLPKISRPKTDSQNAARSSNRTQRNRRYYHEKRSQEIKCWSLTSTEEFPQRLIILVQIVQLLKFFYLYHTFQFWERQNVTPFSEMYAACKHYLPFNGIKSKKASHFYWPLWKENQSDRKDISKKEKNKRYIEIHELPIESLPTLDVTIDLC